MGDIITWIIGIPIIAVGLYIFVKSIKKEIKGGGCSGCSGCSSKDDSNCPTDTKY